MSEEKPFTLPDLNDQNAAREIWWTTAEGARPFFQSVHFFGRRDGAAESCFITSQPRPGALLETSFHRGGVMVARAIHLGDDYRFTDGDAEAAMSVFMEVMRAQFNVPEQLSPRLKWLREHGVTIQETKDADAPEHMRFLASCWPAGVLATGETEHDAIVSLALRQGWKLWSQL